MRKKIEHNTELTNVRNVQIVRLDLMDALYHFEGARLCAKLSEGILEFRCSKGTSGATESDKVLVRFSKPVRVDALEISGLLASLPVFSDVSYDWFLEKLSAYPNMLKMSVTKDGVVIVDTHLSH